MKYLYYNELYENTIFIKQEIEELIDEWEPEELVPDISDDVRKLELDSVPTLKG